MISTYTLIDLAGSIALLLLGTKMLEGGAQLAFGPGLQLLLAQSSSGRLHAFVGGIGVTAIVQNSGTTSLMTAGLAAGGLIDLVTAFAIMLGASVGTTLIVQALSFDMPIVSPALILVGTLLFSRASNSRAHDIGRMFIGLGLILIALHELHELVMDYEDAPSLRMVLGAAATTPLIDVLLAAGLTWAVRSSVAPILLIALLCGQNVVPPKIAFALTLGANLGVAITPLLEANAVDDLAAKRLAVGNLLTRLFGVAVALAALGPIGRFMVTIEPENARVVGDFHTLFNLILAALFLPWLTPFANLIVRLLPLQIELSERSRPIDLHTGVKPVSNLAKPAIYGARRESSQSDEDVTLMRLRTRSMALDWDERNAGADRQERAADSHTDQRSTPADLANSLSRAGRQPQLGIVHRRDHIEVESRHSGYYPATSLWLTLQDLRLIREVEPIGVGQSTIATYVLGTAEVDDYHLSIIGEDEPSTRTIEISFATREIELTDRDGLRQLQKELGTELSDIPLGTARLGYNRPDRDMCEPDKWWVSCHIPASSMRTLAQSIEEGQLSAGKIGLCLQGIYMSRSVIAGTPKDSSIYLWPQHDTMGLPEGASGYVINLALDFAKITLGGSAGDSAVLSQGSLRERASRSEASATDPLTEKLGKLVTCVKWLAALVAVMLVAFVLRLL
ncbi:Na/Pi cotransporter family protein [Cupriavidus metallidurans]|nr:Na/Pi symporter [Cupriavidus metallidurans]UBM07911.1 Na/Pi symporter [Cupriavidus metallidurans]